MHNSYQTQNINIWKIFGRRAFLYQNVWRLRTIVLDFTFKLEIRRRYVTPGNSGLLNHICLQTFFLRVRIFM